jgi:RNA ligase
MFYEFPQINHINDVLEVIKDNDCFSVLDKKDYTVICYNVMGSDTFPDVTDKASAIFRECRGIIFSKDGYVASRPYHKFFNLNEREETNIKNIDFKKPHVILEKLDGSMITPFYQYKEDKYWRLASKRGITDVSKQAEMFVVGKSNYYEFISESLEIGCTPIFEWCSNKNRIVLSYPEDRLVLTAMRWNNSGIYYSYDDMIYLAQIYGIDYARAFYVGADYNIDSFIDYTRHLKNEEGYVFRFDGHMFKAKSDDYVKIHKALNDIKSERHVVRLILEEKIDDLKPLLDGPRKEYLDKYQTQFLANIQKEKSQLEWFYKLFKMDGLTKKDIALDLSLKDHMSYMERSCIFAAYDGKDILEQMTKIILQKCGSNTKLLEVRHLYNNLEWNIDNLIGEE